MTFRTEFHKYYALEVIKEKAGEFLPRIIKENKQYLKKFEEQGAPFWSYLPDELRQYLLDEASPYCETILALDPDETTDVIMEALAENRLKSTFKKEWIKLNLMAFREELQSILS